MYTMMEACRETGLTYQTIKFYCNEGLIPNVHRDKNNRRYFDDATVTWIKNLNCLKKCGMSIAEMKEYVDLALEGTSTIPQRQIILTKKQDALRKKIQELQASVEYIDWKQEYYKDILAGKQPNISKLIKEK